MRVPELFILCGLMSTSLATSCYQTGRRDGPFGAGDDAKDRLYALREKICSSWSGSCNEINDGRDGDGTAKASCWNQSDDDGAFQAIMFGANPTDNNGCWDGMKHAIDDCLTQTFSSDGLVPLQSYGITGLYSYNDNVYVMTRVGNQDWGMK